MPKRRKRRRFHDDSAPRGRDRVRLQARRDAAAREALERTWQRRIVEEPAFAPLVVHDAARAEPWHRWLPYRQGFSPALVRRFLEDAALAAGPVLDPFCGSGTTVLECARAGRPAVGVEPLASLARLTDLRCRWGADPDAFAPPQLPDGLLAAETPDAAWAAARTEAERACVLLAAARTVKGDGKPRKDLPPFAELLRACAAMAAEDRRTPLRVRNHVLRGDARALPFATASAGGVLTSPPYLSRYDYTRVTDPAEQLLAPPADARAVQVRAHRRARARTRSGEIPPAVAEGADRLREAGKKKSAGVAVSYAEDLREAVLELARVLRPGAPLVMVIAGANLDGVYFPMDLVAAVLGEAAGLAVEEIVAARTFGAGKRLGGLPNTPPRECLVSFRKPAR